MSLAGIVQSAQRHARQRDLLSDADQYGAIMADPPWRFETFGDKGRGRSPDGENVSAALPLLGVEEERGEINHYPTMSTAEICALPVGAHAARHCALFMWATLNMMPEALQVGAAWGFRYKTARIWAKIRKDGIDSSLTHEQNFPMGTGYIARCLAGGTTIHVFDRDRDEVRKTTIAELEECDLAALDVWTHKGWRKIINFYANGVRPIVRTDTRVGPVFSTREHRWASKAKKCEGKAGTDAYRRLHHLDYRTTEEIARLKRSTKRDGVNMLFSRQPIEHPQPRSDFDGVPLDYEAGWIVGLFVAEGNFAGGPTRTQVRFTVHQNEKPWVERIQRFIDKNGIRNERYFNESLRVGWFEKSESKAAALYFHSGLMQRLIRQFVLGNGAHGKRLAMHELLQAPAEFRRGMLDGFLDGDGGKRSGLNYYRGYLGARLCNEALIEDVRELCHGLGLPTCRDKSRLSLGGFSAPGSMTHGFRFALHRLPDMAFEGAPVTFLRIDGFEDEVPEETFDIEVEGHSFVADWCVSHNSNPEALLIFTRGEPAWRDPPRALIIAPRREHSRKPDGIREEIAAQVDGPYLELFARTQPKNWDTWGNEIGKFEDEDRSAETGASCSMSTADELRDLILHRGEAEQDSLMIIGDANAVRGLIRDCKPGMLQLKKDGWRFMHVPVVEASSHGPMILRLVSTIGTVSR